MSRIDALLDIMARLRDPKEGCPWDLEQDFASISPHTIEEAYEVDEAIASGDLEALRDELGDLLFQVVFQARLAEEEGAFDFEGVIEAIVDKLVRRHPHVFANAKTPSTVEAQLANWEEIKAAERAAAGWESRGAPDPFAGIPRNLPALARSAKIAGRLESLSVPVGEAHRVRDASEALEQLSERERAVREVLGPSGLGSAAFGSGSHPTRSARRDAQDAHSGRDARDARDESAALVGQGLRAWVQLARALGIDPERALREVDDEIVTSTRAKRLRGVLSTPHERDL